MIWPVPNSTHPICSFCFKDLSIESHDVERVQGGELYICNDCVRKRIAKRTRTGDPTAQLSPEDMIEEDDKPTH